MKKDTKIFLQLYRHWGQQQLVHLTQTSAQLGTYLGTVQIRIVLPLLSRYYTVFYTSNTIIGNARLKLTKAQAKPKQHPQAELVLFEIYSLSLSTLLFKNNKSYSKKCTKIQYVCVNKVIWLMTMKMSLNMKNMLHRNGINI